MYEDRDFLEIGFTHLSGQACDVEKENKKGNKDGKRQRAIYQAYLCVWINKK